MGKLTIKEIAKMAGVSPTAVTFVINNKASSPFDNLFYFEIADAVIIIFITFSIVFYFPICIIYRICNYNQ